MRRQIATVINDSINGTLLFDDVPESYVLGLVSSTAASNGVLELH